MGLNNISTAADGILGGQFGNVPGLAPANPFASIQSNPLARTTPTIPGFGSTASLTGANIGPIQGPPPPTGYVRPLGNPQTQADVIRQQQITQLTTPYTGSLAALTGANMFQPSNLGFPGTDPRQPVTVSNATVGIPNPPPLLDLSSGSVGGGGGYRRRGGGGGSGYSSGGGSGYDYPTSDYARSYAYNWRLATG